MQHLAQKVPKSLADKSQQGILREIRLEMEQIYSHHYIIHYWPLSEADPRLYQELQFSHSHIGMYRKGTKLCTSCFWEIPTESLSWSGGLYN